MAEQGSTETVLKSFVVDVDRWARKGTDHPDMGSSSLRNTQGNMCCLGFVVQQCGGQTLGAMPTSHCFSGALPKSIRPFLSSMLSDSAANINDSMYTTDKEKIAALKKLFSEHGLEIRFVRRVKKLVKVQEEVG